MIRTYYLLTKPGILAGNLLTTTAAFFLGSRGNLDWFVFLMTTLGLGCIIASACVVNNCIDRHADAKMERTKHRALPKGIISLKSAIFFALFLAIAGSFLLLAYTNGWAFWSAAAGFFIYVVLYSIGKYRTMYATFVGSVAGAMPPVVGYCAASGQFDLGAGLLFSLLVFWQMPHFFAISVYRFQEYAAASIPVVSGEIGNAAIKKQSLLYILFFLTTIWMLLFYGYTGYFCTISSFLIGLVWLKAAMQGFKTENDIKWARHMFQISLIVILGISCLLCLDHWIPTERPTRI